MICGSLLTKGSSPTFADPFIRDHQKKIAKDYTTCNQTKKNLTDAENIKFATILLSPLILRLTKPGTPIRRFPTELTREIIKDLKKEEPNPVVSAAFHHQLIGHINHGQENDF